MTAQRAFAAFHNLLDLVVATLAGLAVAFLAFAAPAEMLDDLVAMTGLPSLLPAAAPPLGGTARIAIGALGGLAAFGIAFAALRWLDRFARVPARPILRVAPDEGAPRLRRRDLHPDAPAVRPIQATRDFGDPAAALPAWIAPEADFDEEVAAEVPAAAASAPTQPEPATLAELMARLEDGLARRHVPTQRREAPAAPERRAPSDDRLQSAIESLQRLATRQA
ncbi:hypothetical protein RCO27_14830 [Sphingosinicella sp. LHD-64]|uniref:hypothetical protein n=1 Tax=Sphingosinicella sp. LHD-64 TaxID=3072139 RepID=UPI00280D2707|nr:hypothetical protein [Sphingosinicella sp. LHD-64]MDQ8757503.1 hypothetical protein [Sphingosinicella sp. LHD-64]